MTGEPLAAARATAQTAATPPPLPLTAPPATARAMRSARDAEIDAELELELAASSSDAIGDGRLDEEDGGVQRAPDFRGTVQRSWLRRVNAWLAVFTWLEFFAFIGIADNATKWKHINKDAIYLDATRHVYLGEISCVAIGGVLLGVVALAHTWWCIRRHSWDLALARNEVSYNNPVTQAKGEVGYWAAHLTMRNGPLWTLWTYVALFSSLVVAVMSNVRDLATLLLVVGSSVLTAVAYKDCWPAGLSPVHSDRDTFDASKQFGERQRGSYVVAVLSRLVYYTAIFTSLASSDPDTRTVVEPLCAALMVCYDLTIAIAIGWLLKTPVTSSWQLWKENNDFSGLVFFPFAVTTVTAWFAMIRASPSHE